MILDHFVALVILMKHCHPVNVVDEHSTVGIVLLLYIIISQLHYLLLDSLLTLRVNDLFFDNMIAVEIILFLFLLLFNVILTYIEGRHLGKTWLLWGLLWRESC